jgi:hypothetical protein
MLDALAKYLDQNSTYNKTVIDEIKKILRASGLPENILEQDWQNLFSGKSQNEQKVLKNHLIKLIEKALNNSTDLSEKEKSAKKKQLITRFATVAKSLVQTRMTEAHPKLVVSEAEIPVSILAPCRSIEEKFNACSSTDEVSTLESRLLAAIDQQQEVKLTAIQERAIAEIRAELEKGPGKERKELGLNENFEEVIRGMVDPSQIESKKNLILDLLVEQTE